MKIHFNFRSAAGIAFIAIIGFGPLSSCEKADEDSSLIYNNRDNKTLAHFESYGISHNLAMDYVAANPNFDKMSKHEIYTYIQGYSDNDFTFDNDTNWDAHNVRLELAKGWAENPKTVAASWLSEEKIKASEFGIFDSLFQLIDKGADYDSQTYLSVKDFHDLVGIYEQHIKDNYEVIYDPQSKEGNLYAFLLATTSILRHSYEYWHNAATDPSHVWHEKFLQLEYNGGKSGQKLSFGDIWRAIKVGAVDTGVFVGSIFGGCNQGSSTSGLGPIFSFSCSWRKAGEASSGV